MEKKKKEEGEENWEQRGRTRGGWGGRKNRRGEGRAENGRKRRRVEGGKWRMGKEGGGVLQGKRGKEKDGRGKSIGGIISHLLKHIVSSA